MPTWKKPHGLTENSKPENLDKGTTWITQDSLYDFADYHLTFGLFQTPEGWLFREWAPHAKEIFILNAKSDWQPRPEMLLEKKRDGIFEGRFPKSAFSHKDLYRLKVCWDGGDEGLNSNVCPMGIHDPHTDLQGWCGNPMHRRLGTPYPHGSDSHGFRFLRNRFQNT